MRRLFVALALVALAACGGSSPSGPNGGGGNNGPNILSANIDGAAWSAPSAMIYATSNVATIPGGLIFTGTTTAAPVRTFSFALDRIVGPGTYPLGVNIGTTAGGTLTMVLGSQSWWTALTGKAGSVTITSLTSTRVTGTFTATLTPLAGATGTVQVTNGKFDVPLNPGWALPAADNLGSTVQATFLGQTWNAATVVGSGGGTQTPGIGATSDDYVMTMILGPVNGPGTGPLSSTVPLRQVRFQVAGAVTAWGGVPGDQGTLTITSLTATRMAGTFSGTLAPIGQGGTPLTVTNGTFDVRIAP